MGFLVLILVVAAVGGMVLMIDRVLDERDLEGY